MTVIRNRTCAFHHRCHIWLPTPLLYSLSLTHRFLSLLLLVLSSTLPFLFYHIKNSKYLNSQPNIFSLKSLLWRYFSTSIYVCNPFTASCLRILPGWVNSGTPHVKCRTSCKYLRLMHSEGSRWGSALEVCRSITQMDKVPHPACIAPCTAQYICYASVVSEGEGKGNLRYKPSSLHLFSLSYPHRHNLHINKTREQRGGGGSNPKPIIPAQPRYPSWKLGLYPQSTSKTVKLYNTNFRSNCLSHPLGYFLDSHEGQHKTLTSTYLLCGIPTIPCSSSPPAPFRARHHYQPASPPSQATTAAANSNKAPTDLPNTVFVRYTRKTPTHPSAGKKNHLPNPTQVLKYLQTRQKATYERRAHPANVPINTMNVSGRSLDNRDPLEENFPHNQLGIEQHSLTHS